jgi:xanthine dehydrogenase accessory factor
MTELPAPLAVRRTVAFAEAVYAGHTTVEGMVARRVNDAAEALAVAREGDIALLVDPQATSVRTLRPLVLVDAIMAKHNTGSRISDAPVVIALGPGFVAGQDCQAVVETNRGHWLGRVYWHGAAQPDTGVAAPIAGYSAERVLRAPDDGIVEAVCEIGDSVRAGQPIAAVAGQSVLAPFDGVLRGLIRPGMRVSAGQKIGDVDPRAEREHCFTISDKSLAIGGGALEAVLAAPAVRARLRG